MLIRRLLVFFLLALTPPALAQTPPLAAASYLLVDADTGAVLAEKDADRRLPPASLTKIVSAHLYFQAIKDGALTLEQTVPVSEAAWARNVPGSKMFIEVDTLVPVNDLLHGVIVQSGNDAAIALAEAVAGDERQFAAEMNRLAADLALTNSHFTNATGLPDAAHYSSARDIAAVVRRTMRDHPALYALYRKRDYTYNNIRQENRNGLLASYAGATGVKTGYTRASGYCLAAAAERNGRRLIAVVMNTDSPRARERDAATLLTHGFDRYRNVRLFSADDRRALPVWGGTAAQVAVRPADDGLYTLPRGARAQLRYRPAPRLTAPVQAGDQVGELQVLVDGAARDSIAVLAADSVAAGDWWRQLTDKIKVDWLGHGSGNAVFSEW